MAQRLTGSFVTTSIPGSYIESNVRSNPVGVGVSGNIAIIGEADGGAATFGVDSVDGDILKDNFYQPNQLDQVVAKYISGPIVDAFRALSAPSADPDIQGAPNLIYIGKTNTGTKAQATIASAYGTLKDKNYGVGGNKYYYLISDLVSESAPLVTGIAIPAFGAALNGVTFGIRQNGGAMATVTLSATAGDHADQATLLVELASLLPAGVTASASGATAIALEMNALSANAALALGYGRSLELVEISVGDLASLGLDAGLTVSASEPAIEVKLNRQDIAFNEIFDISADVALKIGYVGTTATATITSTHLTTTVVGGAGANLNLKLSDYATIKDLADYISSQVGYTCAIESVDSQKSPSVLDKVSAIGICSTDASLMPGRVKKAVYNFSQALLKSNKLDFVGTAVVGLPNVMTTVAYLVGGAKGSTLAADVVKAVDDLESVSVNFVVPLFSRDASDDIADGLTESLSTYTIDSVNAVVKNHVLKMSTATMKRHRSAVCSFWGDYVDGKSKAGSLASARMSLCVQKSRQVGQSGVASDFMPWYSACLAAGMQTAGFYKAIFNKLVNVINFVDPTGFDSGKPGDVEDAIVSGLLIMEKTASGSKWVSDQTTYGVDTNFVYNSIQAMYAADLVALDLTSSFQTQFVGKSLADITPAVGLGFLAQKMQQYFGQKLIAGSADAPMGYVNGKVEISGPVMKVGVEIKLSTAIYFIPISLDISQVTGSAQQ